MTFEQEVAAARAKFQDPHQLLRKLRIMVVPDEAESGRPRQWGRLGENLRDEQLVIDQSLREKNNVYVLKCRRLGITTYCMAYLFAKAYGAPKASPRSVLSVGHADKAVDTMKSMTRGFHAGMPGPLRCELGPDNDTDTGFGHNGSVMSRMLAGGKGEGRSGGVTDVHFTEAAFYKRGTAHRGKEGGKADKEMYQAVMASMDDPNGKTVIESTGNGPRGWFYDMHKVAMRSDDWSFLFFPWHHFERYNRPFVKRSDAGELVPDEQAARLFEQDLSDSEREIMEKHALSLSQVRWMRWKLEDQDYEWRRFLKEYPFTHLDPFLLEESGWFSQEALQAHLDLAVGQSSGEKLQVFEGLEYDPRRRYYMGVDTAGGEGGDDAVIQIIRDDLAHCLTWRSNTHKPRKQAEMVSALGAAWGKPLCIIEANKYGRTVIRHVEQMGGVRLWNDRDSRDGNFWMNGGNAGETKRQVYDWAQVCIDNEWCVIHHPETIVQAQGIVSKASGKIEAEAGHDDLIDAFALALWCAKGRTTRTDRGDDERATHRRRMDRIRKFWRHGTRITT